MMTDIKLYEIDKEKYYNELNELNESGDTDIEKKTKEINDKFRDKIRKYLPTCLNIINTNFNCKFSLYKVGNDYDANFRVIETNIKKEKEEVETELQNLKNSIDFNSLSSGTKEQIDLAIEILTTYVDDGTQSMNSYLQSAKPVASSIISNIPMMSTERIEQRNNDEQSSNIQYNPYADTPVNFNENQTAATVGKFGFLIADDDEDLSTNTIENNPITQNSYEQNDVSLNTFDSNQNQPSSDLVPNTMRTDTEFANSDVIDASSLSIFGVNPNKQ